MDKYMEKNKTVEIGIGSLYARNLFKDLFWCIGNAQIDVQSFF